MRGEALFAIALTEPHGGSDTANLRAEDIAAAIAYLASDDAAYVTGVILPVSGGIWPAL